jgi:hypothetical protein
VQIVNLNLEIMATDEGDVNQTIPPVSCLVGKKGRGVHLKVHNRLQRV